MKAKLRTNIIFFILGFISVWYASVQLHQLGALPPKYEYPIIMTLIAIILLLCLLILRFKNKYASIASKVLLTVLSLVLLIGGYYIQEGYSAFRKITMPTAKINEMSLIVLSDSEITSLKELDTIAFVSDGSTYFNSTMDVIKESNADIRFNILSDNSEIIDALYNEEVDALLIREAHRSLFEEHKLSFSWETKVLWNHLITENVGDISKDVNVVNTPFTVYLSGIDIFGPISYVSRSDVNMLVTINPNTKQVLLTSIPRDCWVILENMQAYDKLTHSGLEGVENTVKTVENFLDIDINYYARVNFTSLINIVDAIGGITVYSDYTFTGRDERYHYYQFVEGYNEMNGIKALVFARERHSFDYMFEDSERGDQIRVQNQQKVVQGIANKVLSPTLLTNFQDILSAIEGSFETNISVEEMMSLVRMQLDDMAEWEFISQKIDGEYDYRYGGAYMPGWELIYYIPDETSVNQCIENINTLLNNGRLSN